MDNNLLIDNIRILCKKNKVSISKLEADLFLSPGLISRWNKSMPALDKVADIADYFGVSIDELLGRSCGLSDDGNWRRFLLILYQQSIYGKTVWEILNLQSLPKELSGVMLPKNFTDNLCGCYYTDYQKGFFILATSHTPDGALQLKLYILSDVYSRLECVCSDTDRLKQLYEYLEPRFSMQLNKMKAENLMRSYIQENGSAEPSDNEKITLLRDITEASSY